MSRPIVVGVDGSPQALYAVDWAAAEAGRRRLPLRIVHVAAQWEYGLAPPAGSEHEQDRAQHEVLRPEAAGQRVLEIAEERAGEFASVEVGCRLGVGPIPNTLLEEAADAALLVLGPHGTGGFARSVLGSVSRQAAEHAVCPVVIVPQDTDTRPRQREITVGVDGSEASANAVRFALEEAALRSIGVRAVHAWTHPAYPPEMRPVRYDASAVEEEGARLLSEALAQWRIDFPDVPVMEQVIESPPAQVLVDASRTTELVVVGARGRGGFPGLRLGSVSHTVIHDVKGPLVIVPQDRG